MAEGNADQLFIWQEYDGKTTTPRVGTLADYANAFSATQSGADYVMSRDVLTWDGRHPITYEVRCLKHPLTENHYIPYTFRVVGYEPVTVFVDGAA